MFSFVGLYLIVFLSFFLFLFGFVGEIMKMFSLWEKRVFYLFI